MTPVNETRLRVRYVETDQMGVVYYANYLVWMEVGRVELCKARGFNYKDMEIEDGIYLAVAAQRTARVRRDRERPEADRSRGDLDGHRQRLRLS